MYINAISIRNIRSLKSLDWKIPTEHYPGWHVVIGDNGSGKSTFLRSVALALVGTIEAAALRQNWNDWLNRDASSGYCYLALHHNPTLPNLGLPMGRRVHFFRQDEGVLLELIGDHPSESRIIWNGKHEWFSAAYGPFRRFSGGDKDYEKLFDSNPILAAHLSVFGEDIALTECLRWLQDLQFRKLENPTEDNLLDSIREFINRSDFLPHHAQLSQVSSKGVEFVDGNGLKLPVEELSDGYRSILSLTFELIRQLAHTYGAQAVFDRQDQTKIICPGVVLIDEIDAHLHPTWQRKIGLWFREHFPNIQFIVTTHSPLICQAATVGTVYRLPKPGSDQVAGFVSGQDLDRLLYGNVLDAYGTELFGADVGRSEESKTYAQRLAELNQKERHESLTATEQQEQRRLRAMMPTEMSYH
jgi:predicted ATPase